VAAILVEPQTTLSQPNLQLASKSSQTKNMLMRQKLSFLTPKAAVTFTLHVVKRLRP
jgi:hypothetical protein